MKKPKAEQLSIVDAFAKQFPSIEIAMAALDRMRSIHAMMCENDLFVNDAAKAYFEDYCNTVMRETATWLKDQAKAYGQTKMN